MTDIRELLERDVDDLPPSRVDPRRALDRAHRIRARRRLAGAGTVASVLLVAIAAGALWRGGLLIRPGLSVGAGPTSTAATRPGAAPARFDPMVSTIALGWLPTHLTHRTTEITATEQDVFYGEGSASKGTAGLAVMFLPAGQQFEDMGAVGLSPGATPVATAPVRGSSAYCLVGGNETLAAGGSQCSALRWRYADGGWAQVSYHSADRSVTAAQTAAIVRRVAENATLTANDPVRVPFRLTGAAAGLTVMSSLVDSGSPGSAELQLTSQPGAWHWFSPVNSGGVDISVELPGRPADLLSKNPINSTVDGHPASDESDSLTVYDVNGASVWLGGNGDLAATYHQVHVVANPANPGTWVSPTG